MKYLILIFSLFFIMHSCAPAPVTVQKITDVRFIQFIKDATLELANFESQIQEQSDDLANQIRAAEDNLMRLKEAFLKVQGAKEMLGIIKTASEEKDQAIIPEQLADGTAD